MLWLCLIHEPVAQSECGANLLWCGIFVATQSIVKQHCSANQCDRCKLGEMHLTIWSCNLTQKSFPQGDTAFAIICLFNFPCIVEPRRSVRTNPWTKYCCLTHEPHMAQSGCIIIQLCYRILVATQPFKKVPCGLWDSTIGVKWEIRSISHHLMPPISSIMH